MEIQTPNVYTELCNLHIGGDIFVSGQENENGDVKIHLRFFQRYQSGGKIYPTKKGVIFSTSDWLIFEGYLDAIDQTFNNRAELKEDQKWYIGNDIFVTVGTKYPTVDIRRFWRPNGPDDQYVPTKCGVSLNLLKWDNLKNAVQMLRDFVPQLDNLDDTEVTPLQFESPSHQHLSDLQCDCGEIGQ
ncbi:hypothetical protein FSP39_006839 [Pinctada imbricata]|uniref:Uncharacterized protein n=1 Tax=Pinctada imbricata TaxID=66713 RepID=A0AA88YT69_PINIB|nr:hypothetical protein FSP39_006839 [Pinctada imbricata]